MNKREANRQNEQESKLLDLGFTRDEAEALRRISMTLRRWYELECGDGNDYGHGKDTVSKTRIPDREKGAIKRLEKIIARVNARRNTETFQGFLSYYLQTDPRGASLYIHQPGISAYYNRGLYIY